MSSSMWDKTEEMAKRHDQGGAWLRLQNDGDRVVIAFVGEPYPREVCFVEGKYLPFTDELKAAGHKATLRVALNVLVLETRELKVLEQGVVFFKDLVRVRDKYGLGKWCFEVERHGAAKDPKTSYSILPERQLTAEELEVIRGLKPLDLAALYSDTPASSEPRPIDDETAQMMAGALKELPRQAVERFCQKFGVKRVRDLTTAQVDAAWELVTALTKEFRPETAAADDPFA